MIKPQRWTLGALDPQAVGPTLANLNSVRLVIPVVLEQLRIEREHEGPSSRLALETEAYMASLEQWASHVEHVLHSAQYITGNPEGNSLDGWSESDSHASEDVDRAVVAAAASNSGFGNSTGARMLAHRGVLCAGDLKFDAVYARASSDVLVLGRMLRVTHSGSVTRAMLGERCGDTVVGVSDGEVVVKSFLRKHMEGPEEGGGEGAQEDAAREICILHRLSEPGHPNVVRLMCCFEDEDDVFAVMPLGGPDLFDIIAAGSPMGEAHARHMFRGMLAALDFIHDNGVVHRDVSPENFVLDRATGSQPILIDFGLAYELQPAGGSAPRSSRWAPVPPMGFVGKPTYAAPELLDDSAYDGPSADLWSAAVTLFVMVFKAPPWERAERVAEHCGYTNIVHRNKLREVLRAWRFAASDDLVDLLQGLFREDPSDRLNFEQVLTHPWMNT